MLDIIYLDLDGVFADFMATFDQIVGRRYTDDPKGAWVKLDKVDNLFLNMKPLPYAKELFDEIQAFGVETKILTALPILTGKLKTAQEDKTKWVRQHLSKDIDVICTNGWRGKSEYSSWKAILVDDSSRNTEHWKLHGGWGIQHISPDLTLNELGSILNMTKEA